jgi:anti-sigma factor RsiW
MESHVAGKEHIRQYLLGMMDAAEQERFEERLLTDAALQEEISVTENEIVYEYLTGGLSGREKEQFDEHFMRTPERQRKREFFDSLIKSIDRLPKPISDAHLPRQSWGQLLPAFFRRGRPLLRVSLAFGILLVIVSGSWMLFRNPASYPGDAWRSQHPIATATLSPGRLRDVGAGRTNRVEIPDGTGPVRFMLPLSARDYESYRASLVTEKGEEKFADENLKAETTGDGAVLSLNVPSSILTRGDYQLKISGRGPGGESEEVEVYSFRVIR